MGPDMNPRLTVLLPVYNGSDFLKESVESILNQTFTDFELLVIDDGSTDDSTRIIENISDDRIRLLQNPSNLGLVATLNRGLETALGEYVARMDSDDISMPRRLEIQVGFLDQNPGIGVCGSWVRFIPRQYDFLWKLPVTSEEIRCRLFSSVGVAHPSVMLRRKVFIENNLYYDPDYSHAEDYELWCRAIRHTRFANIPQVLLHYRISYEQVCRRFGNEQKIGTARVREQRLNELCIYPNADEMDLHEKMLSLDVEGSPGVIVMIERWLTNIWKANCRKKFYPESEFASVLADIWFEVCRHAGCNWSRYAISPFYRTLPLGVHKRGTQTLTWFHAKLKSYGKAAH